MAFDAMTLLLVLLTRFVWGPVESMGNLLAFQTWAVQNLKWPIPAFGFQMTAFAAASGALRARVVLWALPRPIFLLTYTIRSS